MISKKIFKDENLYVAGYCNEVQCYIPNKRILKEGGYEADDSMIYYAFPGPFSDDVEDIVKATAMKLMKNAGAVGSKYNSVYACRRSLRFQISQHYRATMAQFLLLPVIKVYSFFNLQDNSSILTRGFYRDAFCFNSSPVRIAMVLFFSNEYILYRLCGLQERNSKIPRWVIGVIAVEEQQPGLFSVLIR